MPDRALALDGLVLLSDRATSSLRWSVPLEREVWGVRPLC